jgi:hypothetical protein
LVFGVAANLEIADFSSRSSSYPGICGYVKKPDYTNFSAFFIVSLLKLVDPSGTLT